MTLDEIKQIELDAQRQESLAGKAKNCMDSLARKRLGAALGFMLLEHSADYGDKDIYRHYGNDSLERDTLLPIIAAAIPDLIRIAELQFAAMQRVHSENAKRLRAQIAAYFTEPTKEIA